MSEWISVEDRLPEELGHYICYRPESNFEQTRIQMFKSGKFSGVYDVTHWQPLPAPPQVKG